jgi:hypothetical protein
MLESVWAWGVPSSAQSLMISSHVVVTSSRRRWYSSYTLENSLSSAVTYVGERSKLGAIDEPGAVGGSSMVMKEDSR